MKVRELFEKAEKQKTLDTFIELYERHAVEGDEAKRQKVYDVYGELWETLKKKPDKEYTPVTLLVFRTINADEGEELVDIVCYDGENEYAIDFIAWEDVCNYYVAEAAFDYFDISELAAHLLWELSFHGVTEEAMQERRLELDEAIAEVEDSWALGTVPNGEQGNTGNNSDNVSEEHSAYNAQIARIKTERGLD